MLFGKKKDQPKYQLLVGKLLRPVPQIGDGPFTVRCFAHLAGKKAGRPSWRDAHDRSRFSLELQLQQLPPQDKKPEDGGATPATPVAGLEGLTSVSGLDATVTCTEDSGGGGLRFDLDRLHIPPGVDKGTFRIRAKLYRARRNRPRELLAEADSEPFTRGDMTKHRLPDGCEMFHGCGGMR